MSSRSGSAGSTSRCGFGPSVGVVDAQAPMGLRYNGKRLVEVPLAIDTALRNVDQLDTYGAELLAPFLAAHRSTMWIDAAFLGPGEASTSTTAMLGRGDGDRDRAPVDLFGSTR